MTRLLIGFLISLTASFVVYWPSMTGEFIMDDRGYITQNPLITQTDSPGIFWTSFESPDFWPLSYSAYWLLFRLFGESPLGYHFVNVVLHAFNATLILSLTASLGLSSGAGAFAALLFLVHPLHVQAVSWMIQLKTLLATSFALLAFLAFLSHLKDGRSKSYVLAVFLFAFSLLSKTSSLFLPLVLTVVAWPELRDGRIKWARLVPFYTLSWIGGLLTLWSNHLHFQESAATVFQITLGQRFWLACQNFLFYTQAFVGPWPLAYQYPYQVPNGLTVRPLAGLALALIFCGWMWRRGQWTRDRLALAYLILLAPCLGFVNIPNMKLSLVADHWAYLPNVFLILWLAFFVNSFWRIRHVRVAAAGVLLLLAVLSVRQARHFESEERFWLQSQRLNPESPVPLYNLGVIRDREGRTHEALDFFEEALVKDPRHDRAWFNKARSHFLMGDLQKARFSYGKTLEINPQTPLAFLNLAKIAHLMGDPESAVKNIEAGFRILPGHSEMKAWREKIRRATDSDSRIRQMHKREGRQ